jgi:hypothetical protein
MFAFGGIFLVSMSLIALDLAPICAFSCANLLIVSGFHGPHECVLFTGRVLRADRFLLLRVLWLRMLWITVFNHHHVNDCLTFKPSTSKYHRCFLLFV